MPAPPQSEDYFDSALTLLGGDPSRSDIYNPSSSGLGTRQAKLRNELSAQSTRKIVHWMVPEGPIVQMYINPQNIVTAYAKDIQSTRTKGGFVIQYWGEKLTRLTINGTTGTSGIEGINVLYDIYRNEQLAFDPYALFLASKQKQDTYAGDIFGIESALSSTDNFMSALVGASEEAIPQAAKQGPTLASLATRVEMYWSGEIYRGYFESFNVTESVNHLGMFNYDIVFMVTQKRGYRRNFLAWHRSAVHGPSYSDPTFGPPHTFGKLIA
jgi:hypothetical protein